MTITCQPVDFYIRYAYIGYQNGQRQPGISPGFVPMSVFGIPIEGEPSWAKAFSNRFTIEAKASDAATAEMMMGPMLQSLLEERFQLRLHSETREVPVYDLTVAKGGPRLGDAEDLNCVFGPSAGQPDDRLRCTLALKDATIAQLAATMRPTMDRPIIDKTGIMGQYSIRMWYQFPPDSTKCPQCPEPEPGTPTIFEAFEQQLGLKLTPAKGPDKILVIDHIEEPTPN